MTNRIVKIIAFALLGAVIIGSCFWKRPPMERYRESRVLGTTTFVIDACLDKNTDSKKVSRALNDVWQRLQDVSYRTSNVVKGNDLEKMNRSHSNPQHVGIDTIAILKEAARYHKLTEGTFDITGNALTELWKKGQRENRMPTPAEIEEAKKLTGLQHVRILFGNRIEIAQPRIKVDYGGIATAYAIDEAVKILQKKGIRNFLINADGSMFASGRNCTRTLWKIAIKNPEESSRIMDVVEVSNASVGTFGDYNRFYQIQGQKFAGDINPKTGRPQKGVVSATVIAPTAMENEAYARMLVMLDTKEGIGVIDALGKKYAGIVIHKEPNGHTSVLKSVNYKNFQIKKDTR